MRKFSEIDFSTSPRDQLLISWSQRSGLSKAMCGKLYENFVLRNPNSNDVDLNENFNQFINNGNSLNMENIRKIIAKYADKLSSSFNEEERNSTLYSLIEYISKILNENIESPNVLDVFVFIVDLFANSVKRNYNRVKDLVDDYYNSKDFTPSTLNESKLITDDLTFENNKSYKVLFESVLELLVRNDKKFGYTIESGRVYQRIMNELKNNIKYLTDYNIIQEQQRDIHLDILKQLKNNTINLEYQTADILRKMVPDLQSLIFDLAIFVHSYYKSNEDYIEYLDERVSLKYQSAIINFLKTFSSSFNNSKIIQPNFVNQNNHNVPECSVDDIFDNFYNFDEYVSNYKYNELRKDDLGSIFWGYKLKADQATKALQIIKSLSGEFSLHTRGAINIFVTHAWNIIQGTNKKIHLMKNNKFKNGLH